MSSTSVLSISTSSKQSSSPVRYAFKNQNNRRNLTGTDFVKAVKILDAEKRKAHGSNQYTTKEELSVDNSSKPQKSHETVAKILDTSPANVGRARVIAEDPIAMAEVEAGVSISLAAERVGGSGRTIRAIVA